MGWGTRGRTLLAVALAAGVGVAAGCGDDDDAAAISKGDFIAQAGEICRSGDRELEATGAELFAGGEPDPQDMRRWIDEVFAPTVRGQVADIRALGAPAGDEDEIAAILDAADRGVDEIHEDPSRLGSGDNSLDEATRSIVEYGVEECG